MVVTKVLRFNRDQVIKIFEASHGLEAVTQCQEHDFDLVFMDLRMPRMDGFEATREIRKNGGDMPIVVITSEKRDSIETMAFEAGVNDIYEKPVSRNMIDDILKKYGIT